MRPAVKVLSLLIAGIFSSTVAASQGYYRFPSLQQQQVVFTAEGDLWLAGLNQPQAQRLTTHPALESQPLLSNDAKTLYFVANYEGAEEIYQMPLSGGQAQRLTFENSRVRLQQSLGDGRILYATDNVSGPANYWVLRLLDPKTGQASTLPLADAASGQLDEQSNTVFFTRFGLQLTGDNAKVYRGGAMGELWRWAMGSQQEAVRLLADHQGSISQPQLYQGRVYFISDVDGNSNIWSVTADGADLTQHSQHQDWRIGRFSISEGKAVYQLGADLYQLDLASKQSQPIAISLTSDFVQQRERWLDKPLAFLTHTYANAAQKQVVLTARSQIAIASTGSRRLVTVQTPEGSRSRAAILSYDGNWVYAINDASGENEIWRFAADGSAKAEQLTKDGKVFRWGLHLSPDGRYLAHDDKNGDLWLLDLQNGQNNKIYQQGWGHSAYNDVVWSADSQLLAFTLNHQQRPRSQVVLYSLSDKRNEVLTSDKYESYSPAFSPDGLWLYFLSNRQFTATPGNPWGDRNLGPMFDKRSQIFALSLKQQACFGFAPEQEITLCDNKAAEDSTKGRNAQRLDWQQLSSRLWQVPVEAGNYSQLTVNNERLFLLSRQTGSRAAELQQIKIASSGVKATTITNDVAEYQLSHNGKTLFIRKAGRDNNGEMLLVPAAERLPAELADSRVNTRQWQLAINPQHEWQQMFRDAWLMHRDFLFDKGMRGLDWEATRKKYQPLLARVTDRYELDDIFAQMMGELNALHSQVRGGEYRQDPHAAAAASLGASLVATAEGIKITHIYQTDPELPAQAAPLAKPGVPLQVGDVITAINGRSVPDLVTLTQVLRNQAGKQVLVNANRGKQHIQAVVEPIPAMQEAMLRYQDWVQTNLQKVTQASDGQFGYLHLYAMGTGDIASFAREFYAQFQKEGLIIDVRRNRGGNIDSWIIEKLLRRAWSFWQPTHGAPYTNMQQAFRGHLVVLADPLTYSDGETFSAGVRALGLGPVIGQRTAGAGVWLSGRNQLADSGMARVAETPQFAIDGRYIIEGYGVEPDIEVINTPYATFNGEDAQLTKAIAHLKQQLVQQPVAPLKAEPLTPAIAVDIKAQ
ncbi:tricorn protease [Alishewanella longhuensis]|uniref:Tricorn protease homolog n=1 Tax=Alishewanella longhuensis TaxID=1091037 RepID=A0ABQ3L228_9ALTE|nr:S41 family peptidase [Alishewanella longhuensis]GHG74900.1 tricorn protease [Alishewanella longhuensis]